MSWLSWLFGTREIEPPAQVDEVLHYIDIPQASIKRLTAEAYPQTSLTFPVHPLCMIRDRYATELRRFLNALPLSADEIEVFIIPLIDWLIRNTHLLPASEYFHHAGPGGLFIHELEVATEAVALMAAAPDLGQNQTYEQKHHDKTRWIVAAAVAALIHDIGKILDVDVTDQHDNRWNPEVESLLDWARRFGISEYFVTWKPTRQHKRHELAAMRLAYGSMLPYRLLRLLAEHSGTTILSAIDEAVVFGTGPLGSVLKEAEARSLANDAETRRHLQTQTGVQAASAASPTTSAIAFAIKDLSACSWSVNQDGSPIWHTTEGTFLFLDGKTAREIREHAIAHGNKQVPASPDGISSVLLKDGAIDAQDPSTETCFWKLRIADQTLSECLKLSHPEWVLQAPVTPVAAEIATDLPEETPPAKANEEPLPFLAPTGNFSCTTRKPTKEKNAEDPPQTQPNNGLLDHEFSAVLDATPSAQESMAFVKRILNTLAEESKQPGAGSARLLITAAQPDDGTNAFSSLELEKLLTNHKINITTFNTMARMARETISAGIAANDHRLTLTFKDKK